jgi:hypothetical protein
MIICFQFLEVLHLISTHAYFRKYLTVWYETKRYRPLTSDILFPLRTPLLGDGEREAASIAQQVLESLGEHAFQLVVTSVWADPRAMLGLLRMARADGVDCRVLFAPSSTRFLYPCFMISMPSYDVVSNVCLVIDRHIITRILYHYFLFQFHPKTWREICARS